jgi:DNA-directed RNA polymerase subunit beta'
VEAHTDGDIVARIAGRVVFEGKKRLLVVYEEKEEREYLVPAASRILVGHGEAVKAGERLTEGPLNPQDILRIMGPEAVQLYLVEEVQKVYRSQGVNINDKHIETIVRQMLRKVRVDSPGDTAMLPGELVDRFQYEEVNAKVLAEGGEPATAVPVLLGVTKASLNTSSFLAAASFQETTRVLTEAAISGMTDRLMGLKENVIIGKLIPARAQIELPPEPVKEVALPETLIPEEAAAEVALEEAGAPAVVAVLEGPGDGAGEEQAPEGELEEKPSEEKEAAPSGLSEFPQSYIAEPDEPEDQE